MEPHPRVRLLGAVAIAGTAVVVGAVAVLLARGRTVETLYGLWILLNGPSAVVLFGMAFLVLRRSPRHAAGRIMLAVALLNAAHVVVATISDIRLVAAGFPQPLGADHGILPAMLPLDAAIPLLLMNVLWAPSALATIMLLLVFPDGRLPGPGWRWTIWVAGAGAVLLVVANAIDAWPTVDWSTWEDGPPVLGVLFAAGGACALCVVIAGIVGFAVRWRRSDGERSRFRVLGGAIGVFALVTVVLYPWQAVWTPTVHIAFLLLLLTYALAITRFGLHDLEPVLGKGAVAALLSAAFAAIYLAVVVGFGRLVGAGVDDPLLPLLAVALIALLFDPARRRIRRLVDRVLYGRRIEGSEVLARLARRGPEPESAVLEDVARLLLHSTGAARVEVRMRAGEDDRLAAAAGDESVSVVQERAEVDYLGEHLGELRLHARASTDLVRDAKRLLGDSARLLGVVLHDLRVSSRLREQIDELRASRFRIVEAGATARRDIERDLHDGAQARLIALRLRIAALREHADDDLVEPLDALASDLDAAVAELRSLARGLLPPVLEASGVAAALRSSARDLPIPVVVRVSGQHRYPLALEQAAYLSCLEAVQNVLRHAGAARIWIRVDAEPHALRIRIRDDGRGLGPRATTGAGLRNIDDRVSALGGEVSIRSAPGRGTTVDVTLPAHSSAAR